MSPFKKFRRKFKENLDRLAYSITDWSFDSNIRFAEKTLVIVKNDFIGDYILFRNFLPYIKQSEEYKDYKIILIGNSSWKNLAESLDAEYYDEMIWLSFDKLFNDLGYRSHVIKNILSRGFEKLFYPVYTGHTYTEQFFISKIKAKEKIKITPDLKEQSTSSNVFNRLIHTPHADLFEIYRYKEMFELLLNKPIQGFEWRTLSSDAYSYHIIPKKPYIVFFPGSSAYLKRWDTSNFIQVANYLIEHYNYSIVLAGSKKDKKYAKAIMHGVKEPYKKRVIDLAGKTSLLDLAHVIKNSELLITNDSASIHMAATENKDAICVFMGENYGRFAPYPPEIYSKGRFICPPDVELLVQQKGESNVFLALDYNPDINSISAQSVIEEMENVLSSNRRKELV